MTMFDRQRTSKVLRQVTDVKRLDLSGLAMPATLEPREYQLQGAAWLRDVERGILADDAGLGKTMQAAMAAVRPVLVTCPSYVVQQWADFLAEEYPDETVACAGYGTRTQRHKAMVGGDIRTPPGKHAADWTIVNTDMHRGYFLPQDVETWICDEMHHFRNRDAERSREANNYAQNIPHIIGLTATPVYKDVTDLWHQLNMLDPKYWSSYWDFFLTYARTGGDSGWGAAKVVGIWNPKKLEAEIAPYILRRTYKDVGLFLPDVISKPVLLNFSDSERKVYKMVKEMYVYEDIELTSASEVMHTLRRATVGVKIDAAKQILFDNPEPTVVFCWYIDSAYDTASELGAVVIDGSISADERSAKVKEAIAKRKNVVATMAALSEGVDLSACKQVIQLEEDYVPGRMYQERRRFQRWTKDERPIVMHDLRVRNTIDMDVHNAVTSRTSSAQQILKDALT
jgi:superfamily II DNA or RNA helicase